VTSQLKSRVTGEKKGPGRFVKEQRKEKRANEKQWGTSRRERERGTWLTECNVKGTRREQRWGKKEGQRDSQMRTGGKKNTWG